MNAFGINDTRISKAKGMGKGAKAALKRLDSTYIRRTPEKIPTLEKNPDFDDSLRVDDVIDGKTYRKIPEAKRMNSAADEFFDPAPPTWKSPYKNPKKEAKASAKARNTPQESKGKRKTGMRDIWHNPYVKAAGITTAVGGTGALGYAALSDRKK